MASVRTWSAHAGSALRAAGITLMSIGLWNVTAGKIFADPTETARDAKPSRAALLGVPLNFEANRGQTDSRVKFGTNIFDIPSACRLRLGWRDRATQQYSSLPGWRQKFSVRFRHFSQRFHPNLNADRIDW